MVKNSGPLWNHYHSCQVQAKICENSGTSAETIGTWAKFEDCPGTLGNYALWAVKLSRNVE